MFQSKKQAAKIKKQKAKAHKQAHEVLAYLTTKDLPFDFTHKQFSEYCVQLKYSENKIKLLNKALSDKLI